ncbi:hypothetical protein MMC21_001947 [Puttea exsequens]|nr:hypothetical protein [Puttea exsequens]
MRGQLNIGGRVDPLLYQQSDPALRDSLLAQQANGVPIPFGHQIPPFVDNEYSIPPNMRENIPTIDTSYASRLDSIYGSPRDDSRHPLSPIGHLSTLDAPMPASFDSQGISYIARHGAVAASVPSKFGLESPPSSLPKKAAPPTDAVRNLHTSAWAREPRSRAPDLGSSPLGSGDEGFGQRIMHSKRTVKPGLLSASLPRQHSHIPDDDDYEPFAFSGEEDFIPGNLQDEVFTPEEKRRRRSRPDQDTKLMRESLSGVHSPTDSNSKVGSPMAGSPSRFGAFFREREAANNSMPSSFGHVGSPLRNSSLHPLTSPSLRATRVNGDTSPAFASPPGRTSGISQLLARARLSDSNDTPTLSSTSHSTSARNPSSSSNLTNRAVSSSSIGGTGRIDEEDGVFSMEEEEDDHRKRYSGNAWGYPSKPSPKLGAIGTRRGGAFS